MEIITSDKKPEPVHIPDPICFVVDRSTSGETGSAVTMDTCFTLNQFEEMGCTKPMLEHILRYSNLLDYEVNGLVYLDWAGLPNVISQEKFDECFDAISEKRPILDSITNNVSEEYELDEVLCIGGRGYIVNYECERIGKYDPTTGLPIVEDKEQCEMLDGDWDEQQKTCDSKYNGEK